MYALQEYRFAMSLTVRRCPHRGLIDVATGMIVRSVGSRTRIWPPLPPAWPTRSGPRGALSAVAVRRATWSTSPRSRPADFSYRGVLQGSPGEGLLLFVDLERAKSNVGLASLRIGQLAAAVLA